MICIKTRMKKHRGTVLLSGYDCELYRDMLSDWHMETISTKAERGVSRTECLWSNPAAMDHRAQMRWRF